MPRAEDVEEDWETFNCRRSDDPPSSRETRPRFSAARAVNIMALFERVMPFQLTFISLVRFIDPISEQHTGDAASETIASPS